MKRINRKTAFIYAITSSDGLWKDEEELTEQYMNSVKLRAFLFWRLSTSIVESNSTFNSNGFRKHQTNKQTNKQAKK